MSDEKPKIEWLKKSEKQCLRFIFDETLTVPAAEAAIAEWKEAFRSVTEQSITLIWDCRKMKNYDGAAKDKWTSALKEMKTRIETIWIISDSAIIRMGASMMGLLTSLKIKAISSESEIVM